MGLLNLSDALAQFSHSVLAVYNQQATPTTFFGQMFLKKTVGSLFMDILIKRGDRSIAIDVYSGDKGRGNKFDKTTLKSFKGAVFNEFFDHTEVESLYRVFGDTSREFSTEEISEIAIEVGEKMSILRNKIVRSQELQAAQALLTGVVTLKSGDDVDFKRKNDSIVDLGASNYWGDSGVVILDTLTTAADFIRKESLYSAGEFNVVLGAEAYNTLITDDAVEKLLDNRRITIGELGPGALTEGGGKYGGQIKWGSNVFDLYMYDGLYDDASGTTQKYMPSNKIIVIRKDPEFRMGFQPIPVFEEGMSFPGYMKGDYIAYEKNDYLGNSKRFGVASMSLPIPVDVDCFWTGQVLA